MKQSAVNATSPMDRWKGKIAVVTGASAGIGSAVVKELLLRDVIVVGVARRAEKVKEIRKEVDQSKARNLHCLKADISKEDEVVKVFRWVEDHMKTMHILVNNAGVLVLGTLTDGPFEAWRKTFDVNVLGLCACTQQAVQLMRQTGVNDGHIIHINSVAGHKVAAPLDPEEEIKTNVYSASKFSVTALTETLRLELRQKKMGTKVTSISPGLVKTEIFSANDIDPNNDILNALPALEPKDIADAVIYVLGTPPHVQVHELTIKPLHEPF